MGTSFSNVYDASVFFVRLVMQAIRVIRGT